MLSKISGEISSALKRIDQSTSKGALEDVNSRILALRDKLHTITSFHKLVQETSPSPTEFVELSNKVQAFGLVIGASYVKHRIYLECNACLMRNQPDEMCRLFDKCSPCMIQLAKDGMNNEALQAISAGTSMTRMTMMQTRMMMLIMVMVMMMVMVRVTVMVMVMVMLMLMVMVIVMLMVMVMVSLMVTITIMTNMMAMMMNVD